MSQELQAEIIRLRDTERTLRAHLNDANIKIGNLRDETRDALRELALAREQLSTARALLLDSLHNGKFCECAKCERIRVFLYPESNAPAAQCFPPDKCQTCGQFRAKQGWVCFRCGAVEDRP